MVDLLTFLTYVLTYGVTWYDYTCTVPTKTIPEEISLVSTTTSLTGSHWLWIRGLNSARIV